MSVSLSGVPRTATARSYSARSSSYPGSAKPGSARTARYSAIASFRPAPFGMVPMPGPLKVTTWRTSDSSCIVANAVARCAPRLKPVTSIGLRSDEPRPFELGVVLLERRKLRERETRASDLRAGRAVAVPVAVFTRVGELGRADGERQAAGRLVAQQRRGEAAAVEAEVADGASGEAGVVVAAVVDDFEMRSEGIESAIRSYELRSGGWPHRERSGRFLWLFAPRSKTSF